MEENTRVSSYQHVQNEKHEAKFNYFLQEISSFGSSIIINTSCNKRLTLLILQPFRHFTYVTAHSPTLPSLYLRHSSFSKPFIASPTSQLILQLFFHFSYITGSSLTSPGLHAGAAYPHTSSRNATAKLCFRHSLTKNSLG